MHRSDLYLQLTDPDGDKLVVSFDDGYTFVGVVGYESATAALDDDQVQQVINHLTTLLETRK